MELPNVLFDWVSSKFPIQCKFENKFYYDLNVIL